MKESSSIERLLEREPGRAVLDAVNLLMKHDSYLMKVDANERSIAHRFALHLQATMPDWHIDCEYNRDGVDPKRLEHLELNPDEEDTNAQTVFPDVIAHRRGTADNYLVIEIKKNTNHLSRGMDLAKLKGYKRELGDRKSVV